ncbi:hypothetical protein [Massilia sp. S19_KUP03_FR1]|uniref:hypothetical protein n=1 Tax=Massilia sp. S19_KUP03_FR1 TaxID=3025503 RepID=UPI002FCDA13A
MLDYDFPATTTNTRTRKARAFVDGLDSWVMQALAGGTTVKQVVAELKALQRRGPQMIDAAFAELKTMHAKMMGHELPGTTAAAAATSSKSAAALARREVEAARTQRLLLASKSRDIKANRVTPNATKNSVKKKGAPKGRPSGSGVPAEHITDYQVRKKHANFRKANNGGKLIEEHSLPHNGIDHLWSNKTHVTKPFVVGETKSSLFDSFKLLAALRADEAANPTPNNGKPNIFQSEGRDVHANRRVPVGSTPAHEDAVRRGVNKPNAETKLATQMSHAWIAQCIRKEKSLTEAGRLLTQLIKDFEDDLIPCPYHRWISLVTGRQLDKHQKSKGAVHEVQIILSIPDAILEK